MNLLVLSEKTISLLRRSYRMYSGEYRSSLLLFISNASLTGCAATTNPSSFAHGTKVGYDPYLRTTSIVGPNISLFPVNYFLDRINGQDYITGWYEASEWAFLHAAFDIDGNQLAFETVLSCVG